ncbi:MULTISPECIES: transporter substrate-binding domain-containing protein [unclassified Streptomyces]|uniref:transporter substrate-binding domain-containing protein n=1 Tax=unclassified Streptomyces TaxID=2593676 RepID=UPI000C27AFD3|nr:transporter substrate-binding domain-containing protein [Streptomyces sp. CB02959]PJN36024.1 glutamate transporter [Streptomyces sp. CB02959]
MTIRRTTLAPLLVLAALAATATACGSSESLFDSGRVAVGMKDDQPGTSSIEHYHPLGFDVDVANHVLKTLNVEPDFGAVPSELRGTVLKNKKKDLVVATFSITADRMKDLDFVGPYASTLQGFMIRADDHSIQKISDLDGKRVCTWTGTTSVDTLKKYTGSKWYEAPDASSCIDDLNTKYASAVSTDQMILYGFTERHKNLKVIPKLTIGSANRYGIAMAKGHRADCYKLRDALRAYVTTSDWDQDFKSSLHSITDADVDWQAHYKPTADEIELYSCRDEPAP